MFFSITNSLAVFQTMINDIFQNLIADGIMIVYLDNILIFTQILEDYWKAMHKILKMLARHKMFLCPNKYEFNERQIKYLELLILKDQVVIDSVKVARVCNWPTLHSCIDMQVFLGITSFYYWFIYGFLDIACLLFNISGSNTA